MPINLGKLLRTARIDPYRKPPVVVPLPAGAPGDALAEIGRYYAPTLKALPSEWLERLYNAWQKGSQAEIVCDEWLPNECADDTDNSYSVYRIEFDCGAAYVGQSWLHVLFRLDEHLGRYASIEGRYVNQFPRIRSELDAGCIPAALVLESGLSKSDAERIEKDQIGILEKPLNVEHAKFAYRPCTRERAEVYCPHLENPPNAAEIRSLDEKAKLRDRFRCVLCQRSPASALEVHHIRAIGEWRLDNTQTLCRPCHRRRHPGAGERGLVLCPTTTAVFGDVAMRGHPAMDSVDGDRHRP